MGKYLVKGEKVVINKINDYSNNLELNLSYQNKSELAFAVDFFIFMIQENNTINKKDIVYYNNPENTEKNVQLIEAYEEIENIKKCDMDLNKIPKNISKIVLGCSVYKPTNSRSSNMIPVKLIFNVYNKTTRAELFNFNLDVYVTSDKSIILGEIYKHDEFWKFNATQINSGSVLMNLLKTIYNVNLC